MPSPTAWPAARLETERISRSRAPTTRSWRSSTSLAEFRGESRFTTWAYKFALYEAAVKVRRRAWQRREIHARRKLRAALAASGFGRDGKVASERT
jgi:hypothetical protein